MINLKIKTLDSQDHDFVVEDDITVRQFKEHIATNTGISADMQRLIYCGRVLNDEKPLREYDVDGKVVHLVERAPPRSRGAGDARTEANNGTPNTTSRRGRIIDGNGPMFRTIDNVVLGAMAIPMNANTTTQAIHSVNPSSTLCMNRIAVARHMLECANNIINYLENPERGLNNSEMDILSQQTMESTVFEVGISAVTDVDVPTQEVQNLVEAFQGAVSAAFRQNGMTNFEVSTQSVNQGVASGAPTVIFGGPQPTVIQPGVLNTLELVGPMLPSVPASLPTSPNSSPTRSTGSTSSSGSSSGTASDASPGAAGSRATSAASAGAAAGATAGAATAEASTAANGAGRNAPSNTTSPQVLAEVVQQMRTVQARIEPFLQQYYDILQNDPVFGENDTVARESAQRVFDRISETLHYMSHAQHAISDLMLNLSLTPRHLCCRPILVEQSAFVSSGFAIPNLQRTVTVQNGNNNESSTTNNNTAAASSPSVPPAAASVIASLVSNLQSNAAATAPSTSNNNESATANNNASTAAAAAPTTSESTPTTATINLEVEHMGTLDASNLSQASRNELLAHRAALIDRRMHLSRIMQSVNTVPMYVHLEINPRNDNAPTTTPSSSTTAVAATTDSSSTTTAATDASAATAADEQRAATDDGAGASDLRNDQPRVTTATHPTTSTQTRSTARPQVHVTSLPAAQMRNLRTVPVPGIQLSSFDRFLPCNSHHIRENQQNDRQQQQTQHIHVHPRRSAARRQTLNLEVLQRQQQQLAHLQQLQRQQQANNSRQIHNNFLAILTPEQHNTPIRIFGAELSIRDLVHIAPNPQTLNRIRTDLHAYAVRTFGSPINEQHLVKAFEDIATMLTESGITNAQPDTSNYNVCHSINNLVRHTLPILLNLILEDSSDDFGMRLLREMIEFTRRLFKILRLCIGQASAQQFIHRMVDTIPQLNDIQNVAIDAFKRHIRQAANRQFDNQSILDRSDVQEFLVIRLPAPESSIEVPMETDEVSTNVNESEILSAAIQNMPVRLPEPIAADLDTEPLPRVVVGSESWHSGLPTQWLPAITRDIGRQRRQNQQGPYSDAYLSGMSSKRRKLITSSKPTTSNPRSILTDSVRHVLQTQQGSTNGASTTSLTVDEALAANPHISEPYGSYEQAIRSNIQNRINTDPDYNAERYPNCSKWINKKK